MSDEVIKSSHLRSTYYTKVSYFVDFGDNYSEFINKADRSKPVVIHSHGSSGISADDGLLKHFYTSLGFNFVMLDFLKRGDASISMVGGTYIADAQARTLARFKELMHHVQLLREQGFKKIYATGHSEGGLPPQLLKKDVDSIVLHSTTCVPPTDNPEMKIPTLHLLSLNDRFIGMGNNHYVCTKRQNYTAITTQIGSHGALADPSWSGKIKNFLSVE